MKKIIIFIVSIILFSGCHGYITNFGDQYPRNNPNDQYGDNFSTTSGDNITTSTTSTEVSTSSSVSTTSSTSTTSTTSTSTSTTTTIGQWAKTYGSEKFDQIEGVVEIEDNGFVVVGTISDNSNFTNAKCFVSKKDKYGIVIWKKNIFVDGYYQTIGRSICRTADGGYLVSTVAFDGGGYPDEKYHIILIKIDTNGNKVWNKVYNIGDGYKYYYPGYEIDAGKMTKNYSGEYFTIYGVCEDALSNKSFFFFTVDSDGEISTRKIIKSNSVYKDYYINSLSKTYNDGYIISGYKTQYVSHITSYYKYIVMGFFLNGGLSWSKEIDMGTKKIKGVKFEQLSDNGYIFVGNVIDGYNGWNDIVCFEMNNLDQIVWKKIIGDSYYNIPYNAFIDKITKECIIVGENQNKSTSERDGLVISVNSTGINYQRVYNYKWYDNFKNITSLTDGSFLLSGEFTTDENYYGSTSTERDIWIVKTNEDCNIPGSPIVENLNLTFTDWDIAITDSTSDTVEDINFNLDETLTITVNDDI